MPALCARAGMDFSKIHVKLAKNRLKISPLCKGWHRFLKKLEILVKMLHEGLVWKISMGGASPLRGAGSWRSYSYALYKARKYLKRKVTSICSFWVQEVFCAIPCIVLRVSQLHDIVQMTACTKMKGDMHRYVLSRSSPQCHIGEPR